jgi:TRAP-type C4-dicarboxylate transport system substrate-binding protein
MATVAPEGTGWAREIKALSREISAQTNGDVEVKWYFGGIAGDEFNVIERVRKGQLDGAGVTMVCEQLAPSLKVMRVVGLVQSRDESRFLLQRLWPRVQQEFARHGLVDIGNATVGSIVLMTRTPVRSFAELRKMRLWVWDKDQVWIDSLKQMGLQPVPTPIETAARAFEEGQLDGFLAVPSAALAFQWSTQARYFTDLRAGLMPACFLVTQRAMDALPTDQRKTLVSAVAKLGLRFEEIGKETDEALLHGLLEKQGLKRVPASRELSSDFFEAARKVRAQIDPTVVPPDLLTEVLSWLADYRVDHPMK